MQSTLFTNALYKHILGMIKQSLTDRALNGQLRQGWWCEDCEPLPKEVFSSRLYRDISSWILNQAGGLGVPAVVDNTTKELYKMLGYVYAYDAENIPQHYLDIMDEMEVRLCSSMFVSLFSNKDGIYIHLPTGPLSIKLKSNEKLEDYTVEYQAQCFLCLILILHSDQLNNRVANSWLQEMCAEGIVTIAEIATRTENRCGFLSVEGYADYALTDVERYELFLLLSANSIIDISTEEKQPFWNEKYLHVYKNLLSIVDSKTLASMTKENQVSAATKEDE